MIYCRLVVALVANCCTCCFSCSNSLICTFLTVIEVVDLMWSVGICSEEVAEAATFLDVMLKIFYAISFLTYAITRNFMCDYLLIP